MRTLQLLLVGAFVVLVVMAGCNKPSTTEDRWSTKEDSVLGPAELSLVYASDEPVLAPPVNTENLSQASIDLLIEASKAEDPLLRANAIEALQHAPETIEPIVRNGLIDENRGVRFVAAMTIGQLQMTESVYLLTPLLNDTSDSVRAAAIFGLQRCGRHVDLNPLATMVTSDDPEVRANAAMVLGELGNPSAAQIIRGALRKSMPRMSPSRAKIVELQMAEAMVKLGNEHEMDGIRAALFAPGEYAESTALACMICGRLKDEAVVSDLMRLAVRTDEFKRPAEVRMAATFALAQIDRAVAPGEVPMEYVSSEQFQLRAQAALTLGQLGSPTSLPTLEMMLADDNPLVQVSAASAILQITGPTDARIARNPASY